MKRTTYIMIGMLVTGVAMVCGLMFYVVDRNVTQKDNFMEIGGDWKTDCARRGCRDSATTFASGASGESWKRLEYYKTVQKLWFYDHGGL